MIKYLEISILIPITDVWETCLLFIYIDIATVEWKWYQNCSTFFVHRIICTIYELLKIIVWYIYWIYILNDDNELIEQYWETNWREYLSIWIGYFLGYFAVFSFYYWLIVSAIILIYHKIYRPFKKQ